MDPKLARLLSRAGIGRYQQWIWFRDCTLEKHIILAPTAELAASLTRCWLPQIRTVLADAEVRVSAGQKAEPSRVAYRGQVTTKAGELW